LVIHVFGVVMWVGALLVLSSLMALAADTAPAGRQNLISAAKRLMGRSANIGALVAIVFGIAAIFAEPAILMLGWFHVKLLFALILIGCHVRLYQRIGAAQREPGAVTRGEFVMLHGIVSAALLIVLALVLVRPF
jgi:protoporphyrinogen IX oxidase